MAASENETKRWCLSRCIRSWFGAWAQDMRDTSHVLCASLEN